METPILIKQTRFTDKVAAIVIGTYLSIVVAKFFTPMLRWNHYSMPSLAIVVLPIAAWMTYMIVDSTKVYQGPKA